MDCDNARLFLPFLTPGGKDLNGAEAAELHAHLEQCTACNAQAMNTNRIDQSLGRAMREVPVPAGMKERVLERLADERGAWRRRWLRVGVVAAAAALVLVVVGLVSMNRQETGSIDSDEFGYTVSITGHDQNSVRQAFNDLNADWASAPNYHYEYLVGEPALAELPGVSARSFLLPTRSVKVPQLTFVNPPAVPLSEELEAGKQGKAQRPQPARRAIVYVLPPTINGKKLVVRPETARYKDHRYNVWYDHKHHCLVLYDGDVHPQRWLVVPEDV